MAISKHIVEVVYGVFADNNLSRILPLLDEKIVLYISECEPAGSEYHGRGGFLNMMSRLYTLGENLSVNSLVYFMPDNDHSQDAVVTTGFFEGKLFVDNELAVLPFVHYWQVKDDRVVEFRAFNRDLAKLLSRLNQQKRGDSLPPNGHHTAPNGNGPQ